MINPLNLLIRPATVYQFAELLSQPFTRFEAYRKGLINESGRLIAQSGDLDGLEYIAIRVKGLFNDLTPGVNKSLLNTLSGTLKLFNEEFTMMGLDRNDINHVIEKYVFVESNGDLSYLDFLLEEANSRMLTEDVGVGMVSGGEGGLSNSSMGDLQGGLAGYDRPIMSGIIFKRKSKKKKKKKKKKGSLRMVEQTMENPEAPSPYLTLQVDPTDYDEILRSNTPSGVFDPSQLTNAQMKKYFKRLAERSKNKQVFVVGNAQQPPSMLRLA